jgi:hypothetical protein
MLSTHTQWGEKFALGTHLCNTNARAIVRELFDNWPVEVWREEMGSIGKEPPSGGSKLWQTGAKG